MYNNIIISKPHVEIIPDDSSNVWKDVIGTKGRIPKVGFS